MKNVLPCKSVLAVQNSSPTCLIQGSCFVVVSGTAADVVADVVVVVYSVINSKMTSSLPLLPPTPPYKL